MSEIGSIILAALGGALVSGLGLSLAFTTRVGATLAGITGNIRTITNDIKELKADVKALRECYIQILQTTSRQDERIKILEK